MFPKLKGKGLFVFSDPGGAKPLLSFIKLNNLEESSYIVSDRSYSFYNNFKLAVHSMNNKTPNQILENENPDYVISGTSYTSKIELEFLKAAKQMGMVSYSFVDHYTKFLERFMISDNELVFPNHILVVDAKSRDIGSTLNKNIDIIITGNFYHEYLKTWIPQINKKQFREFLNIELHQKIILFAPDPISNIGGKDVYGFDEKSVFKNVEHVLEGHNTNDFVFIVSLHPNQNRNYLIPAIHESKLNIIINYDLDINHLIYYADVVVSMFSNILVEAQILNKEIIRYMVGYKGLDPFEGQFLEQTFHSDYQFAQKLFLILNKK